MSNEVPDIEELIKIIEQYELLGLAWSFVECPLKEIEHLEEEYALEKNGDILSALRTIVVLHDKRNSILVPQNMIDKYETIPVNERYELTISIMQIPWSMD